MKKILLTALTAFTTLALTSCADSKTLTSKELLNGSLLPIASSLVYADYENPVEEVNNLGISLDEDAKNAVELSFPSVIPVYQGLTYQHTSLGDLVHTINDDVDFQKAVSHDDANPADLAEVPSYTFYTKDFLNRDVLYAYYFTDETSGAERNKWKDYTLSKDFTFKGALGIYLKEESTLTKTKQLLFDVSCSKGKMTTSVYADLASLTSDPLYVVNTQLTDGIYDFTATKDGAFVGAVRFIKNDVWFLGTYNKVSVPTESATYEIFLKGDFKKFDAYVRPKDGRTIDAKTSSFKVETDPSFNIVWSK